MKYNNFDKIFKRFLIKYEDLICEYENNREEAFDENEYDIYNLFESLLKINKSVDFEEAEEMIRKTMGLRAVMPDAQDIVDQFLRGEISKDAATTMLNELEDRIIEGDYGNETEATFREAANYYAPNLSSVRKTPRKRG